MSKYSIKKCEITEKSANWVYLRHLHRKGRLEMREILIENGNEQISLLYSNNERKKKVNVSIINYISGANQVIEIKNKVINNIEKIISEENNISYSDLPNEIRKNIEKLNA